MMMGSHQAVVDYMTPLGLHHLMGTDHHYGPAPWVDDLARENWNPVYYHRANRSGVGFDRTRKGSRAVDQYARPIADRFNDPDLVGEDLLLWFHRRSWDQKMKSGRSLWEELLHRYDRGVGAVAAMQSSWARQKPRVDAERHAQASAFLAIQAEEARWWRDASTAYWQHVSGRPLPAGVAPPAHSLEHYKSLRFPNAPGHWE
jgi:alpha-glucuronidase